MAESSIPIKNIFYMLCYAFEVLRQKNYEEIETEEFQHVEDMLAAILARGIAKQLKQGLYRTYIEHMEQSTSLKGRLLPWGSARLKATGRMEVEIIYDELSVDNIQNRILAATARSLITCPEVKNETKNRLRNELTYFSEVSEIDLSSVRWSRLYYHRNNQTYEMLMNICEFVYKSLISSRQAGTSKFSLFDEKNMPKLFEKFVLNYYRKEHPEIISSSSKAKWAVEEGSIDFLPSMWPDIMLKKGKKTLIIDTKYYTCMMKKRFDKRSFHSANFYQIYTYVSNANASGKEVSGMLLYAKTDETISPDSAMKITGNWYYVRTLDLSGDFELIKQNLDSNLAIWLKNEPSSSEKNN